MGKGLKELIEDYNEALKDVGELRAKAQRRQGVRKADLAVLGSMEKDLKWTIAYMVSRYLPEAGKCCAGKNKQAKAPVDGRHSKEMLLVKLRQALAELSPEEREALLFVKGQGISYNKAAQYMSIRKKTVKLYVERAFGKVQLIFREEIPVYDNSSYQERGVLSLGTKRRRKEEEHDAY